MRELENAICDGPALHDKVFSKELIEALFPKDGEKQLNLDVLAAQVKTKLESEHPVGKKREAAWVQVLNNSGDSVTSTTGVQPKRRWTAKSADLPIKGESARKPDFCLIPTGAPCWNLNSGQRITWQMVDAVGEEKGEDSPKEERSAYEQTLDRAYFMFSARPTRRYLFSLTIMGTKVRLTMFCRSYVIRGKSFDILEKPADFLRILIGLMFGEPQDIGFDPTITSEYENDTLVHYITAGGIEYRVIEPLFISDMIRGRGTCVWKVTPRANPDLNDPSKWDTIKDAWVDTARPHTEDFFINHARENGITEGIPELISTESVLFSGQEDTTRKFLDDEFWAGCHLEEKRKKKNKRRRLAKDSLENRLHKRYVFRGCGIPITSFRNKRELLKVLADLVRVHKSLSDIGLLHRDISIKNLLLAPDGDNYRSLLIDFDYMAFINELLNNTKAVAHRTGTVPFMSIDILAGRAPHKPAHDLESFFYVLLFICLEFSGPGRERNWDHARNKTWDIYQTPLNAWLLGEDLSQLGTAKASVVLDQILFESSVLDQISPYFRDVASCLQSLRELLYSPYTRACTHDAFIAVLERFHGQDFDETIPEDPVAARDGPATENPGGNGNEIMSNSSSSSNSSNEGSQEHDVFNEDEEPRRKRQRMNPGIPENLYVCDIGSSYSEIESVEPLISPLPSSSPASSPASSSADIPADLLTNLPAGPSADHLADSLVHSPTFNTRSYTFTTPMTPRKARTKYNWGPQP
ncbi:hypothetical protein AMATHDRAFT_88440 [Amanita thiersii Skay4041]|uniref:Protein kinase domain-containing protein n=1 Tax=Amanita thiersii Skay4041 TaxID=703135 RepID=A0A2A9NER0_9AGAR|nr:hypothetical protein AMATHDRAFT_88440 [Amanita thiersii Skay4041]